MCSRHVFKVIARVTNFSPRHLAWLAIFLNLRVLKLQILKLLRFVLLTYKLIFHVLQMEPRRPILTALTLVAFTAAARGHLLKGECHELDIFFEALTFLSVLSVYALIVFNVFLKLFTTL